jgi:hypothetical protein
MTTSISMSMWTLTLVGVVTVIWIGMLSGVAFAARRLAARR